MLNRTGPVASLPLSTENIRKPDDPAKVRGAAQQFEALLIGQMMRSVRESGSGWLGSGGDSSGDCATEYAEQQFATVMSQQGGLGLTNLISRGLENRDA